MGMAAASWETLDAEAAMNGIDLLVLPPVRVANIVWARQRAAVDDDEWRKFLVKMTRPLPGTKPSAYLRDFRKAVMA